MPKSNPIFFIHKSQRSLIFLWALITFCYFGCETPDSRNKSLPEEPVDLVYPYLDTENSRWFFFSSACRPFGMVNLSPDTEISGAWGSGYRYLTDTIKGFSHIHAWQLSGLQVMPVAGSELSSQDIFNDYYSAFSHDDEKIFPGFHQVKLKRFNITTELTSTKRVGFHRYHFPEGNKGILINLDGVLGPSKIINGSLKQQGPGTLTGQLTNAPTSRRPKPANVYFWIELDQDINEIVKSETGDRFLIKLNQKANIVQMKVGISYTSIENAHINLTTELPHWDFRHTVSDSRKEWNEYLGRIEVQGGNRQQTRRFYTDLWHALQGRRIISDVNGSYPDNTGDKMAIKQLPLSEAGTPLFEHFNSDAFWGAQWTIGPLWQLVYPEISEAFVNSLLQYYKDGGLIPRGPSGGNYTYVMTGSSSTPFIVSAYQKGLRGFDVQLAYEGLKKNHSSTGMMAKAGYEFTSSLGGGLQHYLNNGYVPYPVPEGNFGAHQDGASLTLEYAYQDWSLAQLSKALGKEDDFQYFMARSQNYRNIFDTTSGWMRPKDINGNWKAPFDPYEYENGFNESNGAQSTWFVPHDLPGLADLMGGKEEAVKKLNRQFEEAEKLGFTSGATHADEANSKVSRIPVNYGNQPSIQTAFIFNYLDRPDLTQYWSRKIIEVVYSDLKPDRGYNGDEDQGLMGALSVLMKIGLFQMKGGADANPPYEIASPLFDRITIKLNQEYYKGETFVIKSIGNNKDHVYIKEVTLNNSSLKSFSINHSDIVSGGFLELKMSDRPKD